MSKLNSFEDLGNLFGIKPSKENESQVPNENLSLNSFDLRIWIKRLKGNKIVSIIDGFGESYNLEDLAKELKVQCGTGGSVKDCTIVIQGNHREKLKSLLIQRGAKVKLAGG